MKIVNTIMNGMLLIIVMMCGIIILYDVLDIQEKKLGQKQESVISREDNSLIEEQNMPVIFPQNASSGSSVATDIFDDTLNDALNDNLVDVTNMGSNGDEANEAMQNVYIENGTPETPSLGTFQYASIPAYDNVTPFVEVNNNIPFFSQSDMSLPPFESYSELDELDRCGVAYANLDLSFMPPEGQERGAIGHIRPSGWQTVKYNDLIDGNYLFNRCHLIGFQLSGETDNLNNLITGTRFLNVEGMLPFENKVAKYIRETNNNVLYRATPIFLNSELVARGVLLEAKSVQDNGQGISFCVFCYNNQPGISIDYSNGDSWVNGLPGNKEYDENVATSQIINSNNGEDSAGQPSDMDVASHNVWISVSGECYHSIDNCGRMNPNKASSMSEAAALSLGYRKCSKCFK